MRNGSGEIRRAWSRCRTLTGARTDDRRDVVEERALSTAHQTTLRMIGRRDAHFLLAQLHRADGDPSEKPQQLRRRMPATISIHTSRKMTLKSIAWNAVFPPSRATTRAITMGHAAQQRRDRLVDPIRRDQRVCDEKDDAGERDLHASASVRCGWAGLDCLKGLEVADAHL